MNQSITLTLLLLLLLIGCSGTPTQPPLATRSNTSAPTATAASADLPSTATEAATSIAPLLPSPTPLPTATPRPLAATVDGDPIYLDIFENRLVQYREWFGERGPDGRDIRSYTLESIITQRIVEHAAREMQIAVSDERVEQAIGDAVAAAGGEEAFTVWLAQSGMDGAAFQRQVADELLLQEVLQAVTADVATTDEFVRARFIQTDDLATAEQVVLELQAGADFVTLVDLYSVEGGKEVTRGDLGFFNRGTLLVPAVEETAFALDVGQFSDVISAELNGNLGYFVVQTVARESQRLLTSDELADQLARRFESWLDDQRAASHIEVHVGFD